MEKRKIKIVVVMVCVVLFSVLFFLFPENCF